MLRINEGKMEAVNQGKNIGQVGSRAQCHDPIHTRPSVLFYLELPLNPSTPSGSYHPRLPHLSRGIDHLANPFGSVRLV